MARRLKKLADQVMVITGASSGIGLATAESAAKQGTRLVLAARSEQTLDALVRSIEADRGNAIAVACDVANGKQVEQLAETAIQHFGRIDTWVNNAGQGLYGRLDEVSEEDSRLLFDINFWGVVNGSLVALPHLKNSGGALINIGSEVSDAVIPLLGMYSASKHAVKGFTDALRVEVEQLDQAPVSITLLLPSAVDTPFPQHARNYMDQEPKLPSPQIDPQQVADAILRAATNRTRTKKIGAMSKIDTFVSKVAPSLADKLSARMSAQMHRDEIPRHPDGILTRASELTHEAGQTHGSDGHQSM